MKQRRLQTASCRTVTLDEIASVISKGTTPLSYGFEYIQSGIPFLRAENLGENGVALTNDTLYISLECDEFIRRSRLHRHDVLISIAGTLGRVSYVPEELGKANCNQAVCFMRLLPEIAHREYVVYILRSPEVQARLLKQGIGAGVTNLNLPMIRALHIPLPPLPEQQRIAAMLREQMTVVEKLRSAVQARLEAATALGAAFLRQYLEGNHSRRWPSVALGSVCTIDACQVDPKLLEYRDLPHVNGENIESGTGKLYGVKSAAQDRMTSGKYLFDAGVVLYSKLRPYLRKVALAEFRGLCSADMYPLSFDFSRVDHRFALWVLLAQPFTDYAVGESQRARMPKLNRDQLFAWPFPLPSLEEQSQIAEILEHRINGVHTLTESLLGELAAIDDLGTAMLRSAFTNGI